jgi:nitroreductase
MPSLSLAPDELRTTTRAIRKRLDLSRPVPRQLIEECLAVAQHAPTGSNWQNWHFLVVTDPDKRAALAELYRKAFEIYLTMPIAVPNLPFDDPVRQTIQVRVTDSLRYLADHLHEVPVHVSPCIAARTDNAPIGFQAAWWGSILPATWSFMLAARARGLGTCWTSLHIFFEEEAAKVLGIPHAEVMQAALIPVAYMNGSELRPSPRDPLQKSVHGDSW